MRKTGNRHLLGVIFLLAFLVDVSPLWSQSLEHVFSQRFGDTNLDEGLAIAVDGEGNVLVTGGFFGTVDFGGGALLSAGNADIFLAKFATEPDADADGFVLMPNISIVTEMTDLTGASRAYEASVTVLNATKAMALSALRIGRG